MAEISNNIKIRINKTNGTIYFQAIRIGSEKLTEEDVRGYQIKSGFHPNGFGFYRFKTKSVDEGCEATWECSASCD